MKISVKDVLTHASKAGTSCIASEVPPKILDEGRPDVVLGIDEAGRGPVLGPMIYGAAYWLLSEDEEICKLGYDDSKALSKDKRDGFFKGIVKDNAHRIGWVMRVIAASEIAGQSLARNPFSLNQLSHAAAIEMIQHALKMGVNVRKVFVDTVGHPGHYESLLDRTFAGRGIEFTVRKKADSLYPVVSAASIVAKVTRDHLIEDWKFHEPCVQVAAEGAQCEMGSGYPGDERTKRWLKAHTNPVFGFPSLVRFNWSTAQELIKTHSLAITWEDPTQEGQSSIMSFMQTKNSGKRKRGKFYRNRGLTVVDTF